MIIRIALIIILTCQTIICFSNDTLKIRLDGGSINYQKGKYQLNLEIESLDQNIFKTNPNNILHFLYPDSIACNYPGKIFIYFLQNDSLIYSPTLEVYKPYKNTRRFRNDLANGKLRVSVAYYGFNPGYYSVFLVYYSEKYNRCLKSAAVEFKVE